MKIWRTKKILELNKERVYDIPDFQREIRWGYDNIAVMIEDVKYGPKFLGNVILTKNGEKFYIIDGQQRITILTLIFTAIKKFYKDDINVITPCKLTVQSFEKFDEIVEKGFENFDYAEIEETDKLMQFKKYKELWDYIIKLPEICNKNKAKSIIDNLGRSTFNIIIDEEEDLSISIGHFMDVNLKGKQLDVEDIFKSYLFKNDQSKKIRDLWFELKKLSFKLESYGVNYSILKMLEHFFYCDLYLNQDYKGLEFGNDFLIKKQFENKQGDKYREQTHLIEVVNCKKYMQESLEKLNYVVGLMIETVNGESVTKKFKEKFNLENTDDISDEQLKVIHNLIRKILLDRLVLPKALILKYYLLLLCGKEKSKNLVQSIYGIYMYSILFSVFENKKSAELLKSILKANDDNWYQELISHITGYFNSKNISEAKISAAYKHTINENEENFRYRCKSLATIYNYFNVVNGVVKVKKGKMTELYSFVTDSNRFSIEHFIVSDSKTRKLLVGNEEYELNKKIYNRYVDNLFNYIFIDVSLNNELGNAWLPDKLNKIDLERLECEYSKMIISKLYDISEKMKEQGTENYKDGLDLFFSRDFQEMYIEYAKDVLDSIIEHLIIK